MHPFAALFRLLVALVLIVYGIGGALAGPGMQLEHACNGHAAAISDAQEHAGMPGCHEASDAVDPGAVGGSTQPDPATCACCEGEVCDFACAQHASALLSLSPLRTPVGKDASTLRALAVGHAAPALPSLIRPPIG